MIYGIIRLKSFVIGMIFFLAVFTLGIVCSLTDVTGLAGSYVVKNIY